MVVPAGTPKPIIDKLQAAIAKVAADPDVIERFKPQGVEIRSSDAGGFKAFYLKEEKVWTTLIKERGIKAEKPGQVSRPERSEGPVLRAKRGRRGAVIATEGS